MGLELSVWGVSTVAWTVATLGLVGASVLDRFLDDDGDDADGGDDVFGGGGTGSGGGMGGGGSGGMGGGGGLGGGSGGMGGGMGDGGGGLDGGMGDGGFDDFDGMDEWDDGFDDGGGGSDTDELEKRLDDLEAEVATLSSTVSTVRSENEEISAAVDDIEEDVRNLLDIYEMVTRGINPFVDESSGFNGGGAADGSFGLFDDDGGDETDAELDEDVASADADGFFDEELLDDDGVDDFDDLAEADDGGESNGEPDDCEPADAASETEPAAEDDDMNDDGKSFSELKEEYDAGEADWADDAGDETAPEEGAFEDGTEPFDDDIDGDLDGGIGNDAFDDGLGDELDDDVGAGGEGFGDDPGGAATDPKGNAHEEPDRVAAAGSRGPTPGGDPAEANGGGFEYVGRDDLAGRRGKPYLTELPGDYVGDLLVMEWLEFLVAESDVTDAVRAVNYYERIEWIGPDAAARLRDFLSGFGTIDRNVVDRPGTDRLVREHHTRSLRYITQLNGTGGHLVLLDRWDDLAGGSLVGGEPPGSARDSRNPRGRDRRSSRSDGTDEHARERSNGAARRDGRDRRSRPDVGSGRNGDSPRPMNDPDPHPDRADPADGGWGDGR